MHSPKLQHYWNLTRLFSVINRTLVEGVLSRCREAVGVFYSPRRLGNMKIFYAIRSERSAVVIGIETTLVTSVPW